jgi:hypothetical protein
VCFESVQLISPETFNLVDPVAKLLKRLSPELQQSRARIILNHFLLDEAGHSQDSQVAAHRRTAYIQHIRYFAGTSGTLAQQLDDGAACGVCQSRQSLVKIS